MDEYLPAALLHLREAEVVRLCGLARAARGQEYARTGRVCQAERAAGTLRAAVQEGETVLAVMARFSDDGLDDWHCSCSPAPLAAGAGLGGASPLSATSLPRAPAPDQAASPPGALAPCEHVAALLFLWVREPVAFRAAARAVDTSRSAPTSALPSGPASPNEQAAAPAASSSVSSAPAAAPAVSPADLEHLSEEQRRFLNLLALAGGSVTADEAQRLFVRLELGEPEAALAALEQLRRRGWVQPVFAAESALRHAAAAENPAGWAIPDELLARLPRVLPLAALPADAGLREQRADTDLPALLVRITAQMVDRSAPAPATAESQPPASRSTLDLDAALARQWAEQLETTPEQARFCLALLRALGMLPPTPPNRAGHQAAVWPALSSEQAGETLLRAYRLLLARPAAEALRDLVAQWLHARSARELVDLRDAGVRVARLSRREKKHAPDIAAENQAARQFIVDLLRWTPAGRWWSFRSLVEFVWRFQPAFLRGRQQTFLRPQWWLERLPEGQPLALDVRADWRQGEGRYIALLVRRMLHWLGVVDLALDAEGRLKGFRVTPLGAVLLGAALPAGTPEDAAAERGREGEARETPPAALQSPLQFQGDGLLLAPLAALREDTLERLLWWCEPAGATKDALRFRASAERAAASLDAGRDLEAWLAWLEQHQQSAALTALVAQMRRWAALYGQARVYESAALLEVADAALLGELEATLDLSARFVAHALAPGLVVLRPDAAEALVEEMRRRGYAPWVIDHESADGP